MTKSTKSNLTRLKYAATLLGAMAVFALAPATAHAGDDESDPAGPGGCHHTDAEGYDIPIHNEGSVFVDGKIVSCKGGVITITTAPKRGADGVGPQGIRPDLAASPEAPAPQRPPLGVNSNPVFTQAP